MIFPIGDEPSGRSWTEFQSIEENEGFLLIFRENTDQVKAKIKTFLPKGEKIVLKPLLGEIGESARMLTVPSDGMIDFCLSKVNKINALNIINLEE